MPDLFHIVRTCDDYLKDFITWKLGTLVSIVRQVSYDFLKWLHIYTAFCFFCLLMISGALDLLVQHIRKYLPELLSLISELWSSFSFPAAIRPSRGFPVSYVPIIWCRWNKLHVMLGASLVISLVYFGLFLFVSFKHTLFYTQVLHLVEQLCLALNDEFRRHLPVILPSCIQVLSDAERCNDYTYVLDILHTLEVFGG